MRTKFVNLLIVGILLMASIMVVNITCAVDPETPRWGGTLVISIDNDPTPLCPALTSSISKGVVYGNIWNTLVEDDLDAAGNWFQKPELAESWETSADFLTYTFHLVRNATWHDGYNFTAADVVFSFNNVILAPGGNPTASGIWGKITSVTATDDYTVVFKISATNPDFLFNMASMAYAGIVAKHLFVHTGGTPFTTDEIREVSSQSFYMVGTGAFMFKEWMRGDHLTLVRNPNYFHAPQPYLDQIVYKIIPTTEMRVLSLESGDTDFLHFDTPVLEMNRLNNSGYLTVTTTGAEYVATSNTVHFNLRNAPLNNSLVRHAIDAAIDRVTDSQLVTNNIYPPSGGIVGDIYTVWQNPNVKPTTYNVTYANELLDQAGYPRGSDGVRFSLRYQWSTSDTLEGNKLTELMVDQLKLVGINVILLPMEEDTYVHLTDEVWDFDMAMWEGFGNRGDWFRLYSGKNIIPGKNNNMMGYNNSEATYWLDVFTTTMNVTLAKEAIWKVQEIVQNDMPDFRFLQTKHGTTYRSTFKNLPPGHWGSRDGMPDAWWTLATRTSPTGTDGTTTQVSFPLLEVVVAVVVVAIIAVLGAAYFLRRRKK